MQKKCTRCNKEIDDHSKLPICNSCGNRKFLPVVVVVLGILIFYCVSYFGSIGKNKGTTGVWKDSTRTVQTIERDGNGNVMSVDEEVINGQEDQNGFFAPEWYPD